MNLLELMSGYEEKQKLARKISNWYLNQSGQSLSGSIQMIAACGRSSESGYSMADVVKAVNIEHENMKLYQKMSDFYDSLSRSLRLVFFKKSWLENTLSGL